MIIKTVNDEINYMSLKGCQVCAWVASAKKPAGRMKSPAQCNCLPHDDKKLIPLRTLRDNNNKMNKLIKKEIEFIKDEVSDTVTIDLADTAKKRRGRPAKVKHDN